MKGITRRIANSKKKKTDRAKQPKIQKLSKNNEKKKKTKKNERRKVISV